MLERGKEGQARHKMTGACHCGITHGSVTPIKQPDAIRTLTDVFDYGGNCFVERFDLGYLREDGKAAKDHLQFQRNGEKKVYVGFKRLFRIDEVLEADPATPVFVVEGEKKVNKLWELGYPATCNVGGSGGWKSEYHYAEKLAGRTVMIWPDNDTPGEKFATAVSEDLTKAGVRWHILNDLTVGLPDTGDVLDWVKIEGNDKAKLDSVVAAHLKPAHTDLFELFDFLALGKLPQPEWLILGLLIKNYLACLFGSTQTAKSLWALMQALTLADQGHKVLYLAGENSNGYYTRMLAWYKHYNKIPNSNFQLIRTPVAFLEPAQVGKLLATIKHYYQEGYPVLIVVDTLSKSYLGGDENDAKDMRDFIASCTLLRDTFATSVLVIHHAPKTGGTPRGSSVIEGDFDTLIQAVKDDKAGERKRVIYSCLKQKDAKEFDPITYEVLAPTDNTDLGEGAVLVQVEAASTNVTDIAAQNRRSSLNAAQRRLLSTIAMTIYDEGIGSTSYGLAAGYAMKEGRQKTAFYEDVNVLLDKAYISKSGFARNTRYFITAAGRDLVSSSELWPT